MPQRSPVIFWLLLAATLCVDAVVIAGLFIRDSSPPNALLLVYISMTYAQVSVLCARAVLGRATSRMRWVLPFAVGLLAALIITLAEMNQRSVQHFEREQFLAFTSVMWVYVAISLLLLWLLKPSQLFAISSGNSTQGAWQFTTKHLLILSTCLPILIVLFKNSAIVRNGATSRGVVEFVAWEFGSAAMLIAIAAIVQRKWMWILRLAACASAALAIGLFLHWAIPYLARDLNTFAFSLFQAFVVWSWLETLQLCTVAEVTRADQTQTMEVGQ